MSPPDRPKGEFRSAQHEGTPVSAPRRSPGAQVGASPASAPSASADTAAPHRRQVRWFVGLHLAAVAGVYAVAMAAGGGLASPPFPPDLPARVQAGAGGNTAPPAVPALARTAADSPQWPLTANADLAPRWSHDGDARTGSPGP